MVGRFTSVDPAKDGLNWYAYCENNPVAYIDPSGKEPISLIIFSLAIFGFVFLTGCSAESSPPEDYVLDDSDFNNCYSYAFGLPYGANPGDFAADVFGLPSVARLDVTKPYEQIDIVTRIELDAIALSQNDYSISVRRIDSPDEKGDDEYVVAMRFSDMPNQDGIYDYHFAKQLSDGTWADKLGETPSRWNAIKDPNEPWDYGTVKDDYYIGGYYNEGPIYFAVKIGGY